MVPPQCDYAYDAIYRLINATGREHIGQLAQPQTTWNDEFRVNLPQPGDGQAMRNYTEQYLYDAVGNFEKLIHQAANGNWTRAYAYNEASLIEAAKKSNRLSSTTVGATTEPYTYDAHGNMTSMPHLTLMQWDFKDQLSATSRQAVNATPPPDKVPETTFYVYDAGGQRVRKVTERQNGSRKAERIYLGRLRDLPRVRRQRRWHRARTRDAAHHGRQAAHRLGGDENARQRWFTAATHPLSVRQSPWLGQP